MRTPKIPAPVKERMAASAMRRAAAADSAGMSVGATTWEKNLEKEQKAKEEEKTRERRCEMEWRYGPTRV